MGSKVWFITGASRGFGRQWAEAALARGDRVGAAARDVSCLEGLAGEYGDAILPVELDVTDRAGVFSAVGEVHRRFGRLDVVVNNAGYGLFGAVEEVTEAQARAQFETNVFGALWVVQAVMPLLREQRAGHVLQVSSVGGVIAHPGLGLYHASKWALEGLSESLAQEAAEFGIRVTIIEPGAYRTDWGGASAVWADVHPDYVRQREARHRLSADMVAGDPAATAAAVLEVVDADDPPLRLFMGTEPLVMARAAYRERLLSWQEWQGVAAAAQGD